MSKSDKPSLPRKAKTQQTEFEAERKAVADSAKQFWLSVDEAARGAALFREFLATRPKPSQVVEDHRREHQPQGHMEAHSRSAVMREFFETRDRYFGHLAWIAKALSNWTAILLITGIVEGCGIGAMQLDQYVIAIACFFAASAIVAIKAIASTKDRERTFLIAALAVLCFAGHLAWVIYTHMRFVPKTP